MTLQEQLDEAKRMIDLRRAQRQAVWKAAKSQRSQRDADEELNFWLGKAAMLETMIQRQK